MHAQGEGLKQEGIAVYLMALYLYSNPHATMLGAYYLPLAYAAHDTGLTLTEVAEALRVLGAQDFCDYDLTHGYVWVKEMLPHQVGEDLKPKDKRVVALRTLFQGIPAQVCFREALWASYHRAYHWGELDTSTSEKEAPDVSTTGESQPIFTAPFFDEPAPIALPTLLTPRVQGRSSCAVTEVFHHWQKVMQQTSAHLDEKRRYTIQKALKTGYTAEQLCQAISGCACTPYNMGNNPQGERYNSVQLILRDGDQIDRFLRHYHYPPEPTTEKTVGGLSNAMAVYRWCEQQRHKEEERDE